jgi:hypothetical protein
MTQVARKLFRVLLRRHERLCRDLGVTPETVTDELIKRCTIYYGDLRKAAKVSIPPIGIGRYLDEIGEYCENKAFPLLNALAISKTFEKPGLGYEGAHGGNRRLWHKQVRECIAFGGYDYDKIAE